MTDLAWTSKEAIAIDLIFDWLGEGRINRTAQAYLEIASRLPKLEAAAIYINARLAEMEKTGSGISGRPRYDICYRRAGDTGHCYVPYPSSLSRETIRKAIKKYRDQVARLKRFLSH